MKIRSGAGSRVGIVNALELVGAEVRSILRERGFPVERIVLIDPTGRERGTLTEVGDEPAFVHEASDQVFEDLDLVFFCGNRADNAPWIARHEELGFAVIDLSRGIDKRIEGRLVVSGVNTHEIDSASRLIVSPHAIAIPMAIIARALSALPVSHLAASVIQPASELGSAGVDELLEQTIAALNMQKMPKKVFKQQAAFNVYQPANVAKLESHVHGQLRSVLGPGCPIAVSIQQGPLFHGLAMSIFAATSEPVEIAAVREALQESVAIRVADDDSCGTLDAAGQDEVLVGRLEPSGDGTGFWIWAVTDNLRRSAALNGVLIAEAMIAAN